MLTLNIACSVRRCRSVNTNRGFFTDDNSATTAISSFRLQTVIGMSTTIEKNTVLLLILLQILVWLKSR